MADRDRLPTSVTTADLREAAAYLRERAGKVLNRGNYSNEARARHAALLHIADHLDAKALQDA